MPTAKLPPVLEQVARDLDARAEHTPATLAAALRRPIGIDDVAPWIRFDPTGYVRSLVTRGERWELRLLCWRPGQTSSLHAHGGAACAFRVLRGSAAETILGRRDHVWAAGDVVEEATPGLVHQVGNAGPDAMLSLHAYSPPLPVDAPSLLAAGLAAADPAGLGIVTDDHGRVIDPAGAPSERIFALGAPRRASSWETTAVPDISLHALALARRIVP